MCMRVPIRESIRSLPPYLAGARPPGEGRYARLASNENPFPPLPSVQAAISSAAGRINRYPELLSSTLCDELAARHRIDPAQIVAGTGSVAVLAHAVTALAAPGDEVIYAWRSFESYPIVCGVAGATSVRVPLIDHRHDLTAMAAAITERTRAVIVCSPNNPTSTAITRTELAGFLTTVPDTVAVLLDEAYIEFCDHPDICSGIDLVATFPNLVVLRTFSKAYGLAGLRVGYSVSHPDLASAIRSVSTPFGVNEVAAQAALASLTAEAELLARVEELVATRAELAAALAEQGWDLPASQANFFWFPLGDATMAAAELAVDHQVLVRPFAGEGVRVSIGDATDNAALLAVTAAWRDVVAR